MGGETVCRKCVYVCGTILLVFWDNYPNCAPQALQGKRSPGMMAVVTISFCLSLLKLHITVSTSLLITPLLPQSQRSGSEGEGANTGIPDYHPGRSRDVLVRWGGIRQTHPTRFFLRETATRKCPTPNGERRERGHPPTRGMTAVHFWGLLDSRSQLLEASDMCDAQFIHSPREQGIHHPRILG